MKHPRQSSLLAGLALTLMVGLATFASAQEITGSIVGSVKDSAGAVVAGATITITDPAKKALS